MIPKFIKNNLEEDDKKVSKLGKISFDVPRYDPKSYSSDIAKSSYFYALVILRHYVKTISDYYFGGKIGAKNIDLFMLTPSISSPMGPGSDSEPIKIQFGNLETFLVDSSQFGFEPLLLTNLEKVYCYLPSMRGEEYDNRHLNQFYHCEMEMKGGLDELIPIIEGYIKILCELVLSMDEIVDRISEDSVATKKTLTNILKRKHFPIISFDDAIDVLINNGKSNLINFTKYGRDISAEGEMELMKILDTKTPLWVKYYDRDRVPFYQKPHLKNTNKVINADLLFPSLKEGSFGGEIVGAGERQNNKVEMYSSLNRQNINTGTYKWYIDLRNHPNYKTTSGFGLGIERFIAWALGKKNIRDVILYPRIKNVETYP